MSENYGIQFAVLDGSETVLNVTVDDPHALFGSGSHCDVQLGPELAAHEQLLVELKAGGVFVDVLARNPVVTLNGVPFQGGRVLEDSCLAVGKLTLQITPVKQKDANETEADTPLRKGLVALLVAVLVLGALGAMRAREAPKVAGPPRAPAVFSDVGDASCPEKSGEAARIAAREFLIDAEAQHERAFFEVSDAVRAVLSYRRAAACLEAAGDPREASKVLGIKKRFAQDAERVYHVQQVRLHRAMALGDQEGALAAVEALSEYLANSRDPYVAWLDSQRRNLRGKVVPEDGKKKKKTNK